MRTPEDERAAMTAPQKQSSDDFIHAGGGAGLVLIQLSAMLPGLLPTIALGTLLVAVFVIPLVAVTLAGAVLFAIARSMWRLTIGAAHGRRPGRAGRSAER